jgi:histidyl-tRNA synthetase
VTRGLDAAGVEWTRAPALVRGLDYYRHTAFEFVTDRLGAQGTVLGGGRYDGLMESLGGPPTPAVGWAAGIERLAMLVGDRSTDFLEVAVVTENSVRDAEGWQLVHRLREKLFAAEGFLSGNTRKRFEKAKKANAEVIVVLDVRNGEDSTKLLVEEPFFKRIDQLKDVVREFRLLKK